MIILICVLAWWLGLYLLQRDPANRRLRLAGLGLASYGAALAVASQRVTDPWSVWLDALLLLPVLLWTGALIELLPAAATERTRLRRLWLYGQIPLAFVWLGVRLGGSSAVEPVKWAILVVLFAPMAAALLGVERAVLVPQTGRAVGVLMVAVLFFGLSVAAFLLPFNLLPPQWTLAGIGVDLLLMGVAITWLDAFDQGEGWRLDALRSLAAATLVACLLGGPVLITMLAATGWTTPMRLLLIAVLGLAVALQTLGDPVQGVLDRLVFAAQPRLRAERAHLRTAGSELPKNEASSPLDGLDEEEFARLTRRALSHFGDLPKLTASPLIYLPLIDARLREQGADDSSLDRAAVLKTLLAEAIDRLKPPGDEAFDSSDAWRHYNALYFPYVVGLRPYARRAEHADLDPAAQAALEWFRTQVPERTLYNWQNAAARLVAQHLRELERESA